MPPKATNTGRRKGPSFNPPRPVKPVATPAAAAKRASGPATQATGTSKTAVPRSRIQSAATIISSSDEEQEEELDDVPSDLDELMQDGSGGEDGPPPGILQTTMPPIPAPLLARLLHEHFEAEDTQIQKGAMNLFGNYMSIFVREAIARAKDEHDKASGRSGRSAGFLQVEDLEKLAPQLVLDF